MELSIFYPHFSSFSLLCLFPKTDWAHTYNFVLTPNAPINSSEIEFIC